MREDIIRSKQELCTGCNRCIRECPMEMANITYQDKDGSIKVKIDNTKCIACGRCISACKHNVRYYYDDTELFFGDLANGIPISLIAAPSIKTNIPEYKKLFTWLKKIGVKNIYDVSLGADICIWAHVRHIVKTGFAPLITQPCPAIVTYCEMFRHDLLKKLSPVHSPMACTSIYMKKYKGINDRIAALSPCLSKEDEFEKTGLAQYNVTFPKLIEYLEKNNIKLPDEETDFDHVESGLGTLFPMPGGLKENIEFFMGKKLHIARAEGFDVYTKLNIYAETPRELLPDIFDVLNCTEGCNIGSASSHDKTIFEIDKTMDNNRKSIIKEQKREYIESVYDLYDDSLNLSHFMREYHPVHIEIPVITEEDIEKAFKLLGKTDEAKQNVDCSACGSNTCQQMARKIALGLNIPLNCMVKSMETAREEHSINLNTLEQFETVWDHVDSGIVIIDAETRKVVAVNPAAIRTLESSEEDIIGKHCHDIFCVDDGCPILDKNQIVDRAERRIIKSNDETIPILKSVSRIHYNGRLALLESFTDISHLKAAEEQKHMLAVAEHASKAKSDFLANMSHEIRTPMNAIIGMTSIGMSASDIKRKNYCFDRVNDASKHLLGIINDILDMSKIEAGKFELSPSEFSFEKMMQRVVNVNKFRIDEKHQKLTVHIDRDVPATLYGDDQRLTQVITNLLGNAVKFTPENGSISINAKLFGEEDGICTIKCYVTDSGIGISPEQQARLFQSFQQAESSTANKFGGTGLGLVISKNIVEMMGGKIWIESELGKGASFVFTINANRLEDKRKVMQNWDNVRILVIDDDQVTLDYFKEIMQGFSASCDTAASGEEALRLIVRNGAYDIYFIDWRLPGIDGMELTETLKAKKSDSSKTFVVMMSAMEWSIIEEDAKKAGVDKFLSKPLFPSPIANAINEYLGMNQLQTIDTQQEIINFEGCNILLAEDVEINREIVQALLEPTFIKMDFAENGAVAVRKFNEAPDSYDMIFMDLQMPEMDGYEATRRIRAIGTRKAKDIPIIAMTANVFKEDVEKCLEAGMNGHVGKPLNFDEVMDKLQAFLSRKK